MVFPIVGGTQSTGDFITNSLRFNNPDDPNLSTTFSSAGNRRTFTISAWVKRGNIADDHTLFGQGGTSSGNPRGVLFFANSLRFTNNTSGSSTDTDVETNAKTRDPSAWYHAVVAVDTTQGTAANRVKLYLNGEQQTDLANSTYPDQNFEMGWNNNVLHTVGRYPNNDAYHMDGYISEFYFIDGTQYAASNFGETNDNGVWIPKDAKDDLTFGTNGFYLQFQQTGTGTNSSGMGADTSGNDNHLAVNNLAATDVTVDTPMNNFCTLNPLNSSASVALSEGNTKHTNSGANDQASAATMGFANGKWYWEIKCVDKGEVGINLNSDILQLANDSSVGSNDANFKLTGLITNSAGGSNDFRHNGGTESITSVSVSDNDIINIAVDADNGKIWFGKAGAWFNSGDPAAGSNEAKDFSGAYTSGNFITPVGLIATGDGDILEYNFGNPSFSISSGNADANGYGNFEYAVPSGYYALCTKNLAEYG